ncbi:VTC domain-containing protein [Arthrobacter ginkgonis]|uniref:VTC domain-containing protein n=1 Tax=Arthrobacter ginkgonis TaxID=1630594 RepID=A0ABP7D3N6_9MICC
MSGAGGFGGLDRLPRIGLEELNTTAALQTRIDRKYVVDRTLADRLLRTLPAPALLLETGGPDGSAYDSVYFDTPSLESYRLAAFGRRRRYKIRTRTYAGTGGCFLEVKTEGARSATVKERIEHDPGAPDRLDAEALEYIRSSLQDGIGAPPDGALAPVLATSYRRTTLYLPESGSRATIDHNVSWRLVAQQPVAERLVAERLVHQQRAAGTDGMARTPRELTLKSKVVLETKSGSAAGPLDRHLWAHGVRPSRISKYATGMALLIPDLPSNRWQRTLCRHLADAA